MKFFTNKLITKYPILWNTKLLIIAPVMILLNLIAITIFFSTTPTSFHTYNDHTAPIIIILTTILISFVVVMLWFFYVSKHQTIKNFYPRSSLSIYKEWLIFFFIISLILSINLSLYIGKSLKYKSVYSVEQLKQDQETLQRSELLLPSHLNFYKTPFAETYPSPIKKEETEILILKDSTYLYLQLDDNRVQQLIEDSLTYLQPSFIYFHPEYNYEYNPFLIDVKKQLIAQNKKAIGQIMKDYIDLVDRLDISTQLTEEIWIAYIYNPPFYPINEDNLFNSTSDYRDMHVRMSNKNQYNDQEVGPYYTPYYEINYYLNYVNYQIYNNSKNLQEYSLTILYIVLYISLLVFCCRIFSAKTIMYAVVGTLLLIILFCAIASMRIMERDYFRWTFIFVLFIVLSTGLLLNTNKKHRTIILGINFIIWLLSMPLTLIAVADIMGLLSIMYYFALILSIVLVLMYPISILTRHIKSLPYQ